MRTVSAVLPMMATSAATLPAGAEWSYEVKWDGYRLKLKAFARHGRKPQSEIHNTPAPSVGPYFLAAGVSTVSMRLPARI
jgi:hypothetical protein